MSKNFWLLPLFFLLTDGCTKSSTTDPVVILGAMPLDAAIPGATLSGPLAGKTLSLIGGGLNHSKCWIDSEYWDGTTLWYGITSTNWTRLSLATPAFVADPGCTLPADQTGTLFNVYGATLSNRSWSFIHPGFNTAAANIAGAKLSGSLMAAVVYEKTNNAGNIYFVNRTDTNTWSAPVAFSQNSASCNEDNPVLYANGTKMIFESSRTTAAATACGTHQKLWSSELVSGAWSTPVALTGGPTLGVGATQPWLDESTGKLYWTADNGNQDICPAGTANCVVEADPVTGGWSTTVNTLMVPSAYAATAASDGKLLLVGQFTMANGYAVASCGIATYTETADSNLIGNHMAIYFSACAIPLN